MKFIIVPGTWAMKSIYDDPDSPRYWDEDGSMARYLGECGYDLLYPGEPWWSTNLEGSIIEKLGNWLLKRKANRWHQDWIDGGLKLRTSLQAMPPQVRNQLVIMCHSHGLQVVLYALSHKECPSVWGVLSVAGPDRDDMKEKQVLARKKIGRWLHLQMGDDDNWHWLGTIGSGSLLDTLGGAVGLTRGPSLADRRDQLEMYDHSEVLNDPSLYDIWNERFSYFE